MPTTPTDIDIALKSIRTNLTGYNVYASYAEGEQHLAFATEKFSNAFGSLFREFADNLCQGVIDAPADRLIVTGFGVEDGGEEAGEAAWKIWQANRMDQRSGEAHQSALTQGDAYVMVWPSSDGQPRIYVNDARLMYIRYDEEDPGKVLWAAKAWVTQEKYKRVDLYYPDRIEKYQSRNPGSDNTIPDNGRTFVEYRPEGEEWPLPNTYGIVPVFHLANNAAPGKFGVSELKHVIPLQDALNKSVADMLVAMEFVAYPQRWATGVAIPIDPVTGKPRAPFNPNVDRLWATSGTDVRFGEFPGADLSNFLKVSDNFRLEIARISGTPLHYMSLITDPPSGEALKTLEARFIKKVKDRQAEFGNVWENVMGFALLVQTGQVVRLSTQWTDAAPVSEKEKYDMAAIALGSVKLDEEYVWKTILDIPDTEIVALLERRDKRQQEAMKQQQAQAQAAMQAQAATVAGQQSPQVPPQQRPNGQGRPAA